MGNLGRVTGLFIIFTLLFMAPVLSVFAVDHPDGPSIGPDNAPVRIGLYYDFQCSYCGKTVPVLMEVVAEYGDLVRLVTVNVPGPGHAYALPSAELSLTAADAGKFWEAFDLLFKNQKALSEQDLKEYGKVLGLDEKTVAKNLDEKAHRDVLKRNYYHAIDIGLSATPTVFIQDAKLVGLQPADTFRWHINKALESKGIKSPVANVAEPKQTEAVGAKQVPKNMIFPVSVMKPTDSKMFLKVGDKAPGFSLPTIDGKTVSLSDYIGKSNVVLSFVPAAWTPVCSAQWPEYNENQAVFEKANAVLIGISVDNKPSLYSWTGQMDPLWFTIASDFYPHGKTASTYGILRTSGEGERAVFLIDTKGVIRFIDVHDINAKPDFEKLRQALEAVQ